MALVMQLERVLKFCLVYFLEKKFRRYFREFSFIFDRKQPGKLAAMEKYFSTNIMPFLDSQSKLGSKFPILDRWEKGHPFIDYFLEEIRPGKTGISLNKIIGENLQFMDSKEEPGLRLVDFVCNTIYNFINDRSNRENVECYRLIEYAIGAEKNKPLVHLVLRGKGDFRYEEPEYPFK
jgi:hypothetical protein